MKFNLWFRAYRGFSSQQTLKKFEDIPGPRPYPIVGNLPELKIFGGDLEFNPFDKFCLNLHEKYGDLVRWSILGENNLFVFKPEHAKIVFQNEGPSPNRPSVIPWEVYSKRKNYPSGLVNSQGDIWKNQRSASNPIVAKPQAVAMYLDTHNKIIDEFVDILMNNSHNGEPFAIKKFETELKYVLLEMMSIVAFDQRLQCINAEKRSPEILKLFNSIKDYGDLTSQLFYNIPIWKYFRNKLWREFERTSDFVYNFTRKYVTESYNYVKNLNQKGNHTMLQQYLLNKNNLSFDDIVSIMSEFLLAAFDTTSTTLHFWLHRISSNPDIQEEIYEEILKNDKKNAYIDQDYLSKIPLLKASLKESQRLHSIAPTNGRVLPNDIILDNYLIPKNTTINMAFFLMSKSTKYFKNPEQYDPKRWLRESNSDPINPYTSMPFGFGSRMCIGRRLAEQKMYLIMIKILKNFRLEYIGKEPKLGFRLIVVPDYDLTLKFIPRKN
uniref:Cytochrome p450 3047A1 n=1 Tax=Brachionus koreanus TaxID=1199090 RepID=W8RKX6_9BILA|nr:cytochrome p450 3047A1 [Brachionus koreanus]